MKNNNRNINMTKRKVVGLISLIVFSLAFIFACLKKVLPLGAWIVGTFGWLAYPMCLIFAFISLAAFLGFSYSKNTKPLRLFVISLFAILLTIHSIQTYKDLDSVVRFAHLKKYLGVSYGHVTIVGSFGSLLGGLISMLLGAMGTIISYVIVATISIGLLFDYELYGKYHETHVKKLKTRKVREAVSNSDKKVSSEGVPDYSFAETNSTVDEVSVDARTYEQSLNETNYSTDISRYRNSEIVGEITNDYDEENFVQTNYNDENQELNTFSNGVYKTEYIPDVYSEEDMNRSRREFMMATHGISSTDINNNSNDVSNYGANDTSFGEGVDFDSLSNFGEEQEETSNEGYNFGKTFGDTTFETSQQFEEDEQDIDAGFSSILNGADNDIETEVKKDIFGGYSEPEPTFNFNNEPTATPFNNVSSALNGGMNSSVNSGRFGEGFNPAPITPEPVRPVSPTPEPIFGGVGRQQNPFGTGFQQTFEPVNQKPPVVQSKEINSTQVVIPGVRYNAPTLALLRKPIPDNGDYTAEQTQKTMLLESALEAFNISAKVKNIVRGPKITRFELSLPRGVSVNKIPSLENDIAAALAAKTITIRAPIPGSTYVGIELENKTFTTVYQRELFESEAFQNCKDPLPIAIGKDISGEIVVKSLVDMVHVLIAGSTGSGKSVFIHNIVLSLIYKNSPDDLRLIMIDPKKVEFPIYNGLPHLLTPKVVSGSQKAINALKWCVKEMERRYSLMEQAGFNNIKPYNKSNLVKAGQLEKLPYIVIVVDELAEIMQANKKEAEACIQRITQLARACGMHMVVATQRPSVDIITGVIKTNIPSRIAFSLQSGIDSKTIINTVGAEKLLGKGDMIFFPTGTSAMPRLQASYATDEEIRAVIEYTIKNNTANYDAAVESAIDEEQQEADSVGGFVGGSGVPQAREALDSLFKVALKTVMQNGGASTSYLQRRLAIGYSRAAKIIDQMTDKGYIAQANGSKQRKILISPEEFREQFGEEYDS